MSAQPADTNPANLVEYALDAAAEAVCACLLEPDSSAEAHHASWYTAVEILAAVLHLDAEPARDCLATRLDCLMVNEWNQDVRPIWAQLRSEVASS